MSGTCSFATGTMPDFFCLPVLGITDGVCDECALDLNLVWLLTQTGDPCVYQGAGVDLCGTNYNWVLTFGDGAITLELTDGASPIAAYSFPWSAPPTGDAIHTLGTGSFSATCEDWPADLSVFPNATGVCAGDPHFRGFEGDVFEFQGEPGKNYSLLSDYNINVNALFGDYTEVPGTTYLEDIGILVGTKEVGFTKIQFSGKTGSIKVNDKLLKRSKATFPTGLAHTPQGTVEYTIDPSWQDLIKGMPFVNGSFQNGLIVQTGTFRLRVGRYAEAGRSHLAIFCNWTHLPVQPHGIIGQTADFDGKPRIGVGRNGEGAVDGGHDDYVVKDLFDPDFTFRRFDKTLVEEAVA